MGGGGFNGGLASFFLGGSFAVGFEGRTGKSGWGVLKSAKETIVLLAVFFSMRFKETTVGF